VDEPVTNHAMERIVRGSAQLNARYLEKMQRVQELLVGRVVTRLAGSVTASDPRPAAIVQAARVAWLESDQQRPFGEFLDNAMAAFRIT
jgi:hypothetical protein